MAEAQAQSKARSKPTNGRGASRSGGGVVDLLALLQDSLRLRLLRVLEHEELGVGEVANVIQTPQSTVSRHLKMLAEGGLLTRRVVGTSAYYRLLVDDLSDGVRAVWLAVREQIGGERQHQGDLRRLRDVLAARRHDSVGFFGRVGGEWDHYRRELFGDGFSALGLLGLINPDWVIADLGCGTGDLAELLAPWCERVIAVDQSPEMLEAAEARLGDLVAVTGRVDLVEGGMGSLPIEDGAVDAACVSLVLHHVESPVAALREMRRTLRTERGGGLALVIDMLPHEREEFRRDMGHEHMGFGRDAMNAAFESAGLDPVRYVELPGEPGSKGPGLFAATARLPVGYRGHD